MLDYSFHSLFCTTSKEKKVKHFTLVIARKGFDNLTDLSRHQPFSTLLYQKLSQITLDKFRTDSREYYRDLPKNFEIFGLSHTPFPVEHAQIFQTLVVLVFVGFKLKLMVFKCRYSSVVHFTYLHYETYSQMIVVNSGRNKGNITCRTFFLNQVSNFFEVLRAAGTPAMTYGHARALVGVQGAKLPGALEILHFLEPENGLAVHNFLCVLHYKSFSKNTTLLSP